MFVLSWLRRVLYTFICGEEPHASRPPPLPRHLRKIAYRTYFYYRRGKRRVVWFEYNCCAPHFSLLRTVE